MYLTAHKCFQYRNILELEFEPSPAVNVVCGHNGHGKTNLLESVFLLTGARSFRTGKDASLIRRESEQALIESRFYSEGREQTIKLRIGEKGRTASLNKGTESKASSLAGHFCCVVFSPEHLTLVKGAPDTRRKFIDTALCQISPSYLQNLKRYMRLVSQRNSLLKDCGYVSAAYDMLDVYDSQFIEATVVLTEQRRSFTEELLPIARGNYETISGGRETLDFQYSSSLFGKDEADFDEGLRRLADQRSADVKCGFSTLGPHRDDLDIFLDGQDSKIFASQGQQRTAVLSLKLAEAELMELRLGERPVLLLDDVLSELDNRRQDFLIASIEDTQALITCCDPDLIVRRADARVFAMENGALHAR